MKGHALLIIDMINALDFPQGAKLLASARPAAQRIARLKARLKPRGVPTVYVNDNYGQWRSDFQHVIAQCATEASLGAPLVKLLRPDDDDFFVLKPERSGFRDTPLRMLLDQLEARTLILTGHRAGRVRVGDGHRRRHARLHAARPVRLRGLADAGPQAGFAEAVA